MVNPPYVPDAGDIVWLTLDPTLGHEQRGRRTFLVLTPRAYNEKTSLVIGCPITSKEKGYPFEVPLRGIEGIEGVVLADHVKSLDWRARHAAFIASADSSALSDVQALIKTLLRF